MNRGEKKDVGSALLKKLQKNTTTEQKQPVKRSADVNIEKVWANQEQIKRTEKAVQKVEESKKKAKKAKSRAKISGLLKNNRNLVKITVVLVLIIGVIVFANTRGNELVLESQGNTEVRGDSTSTPQTVDELPVVAEADVKLLLPSGKTADDYEIRINSPPGNKQSAYVFQDEAGPENTEILTSQQDITDDFDIADVATRFNLISVIRVDDGVIYHGTSQETGVQSVAFVKEDKLVLITSPIKLEDDEWVSYYLSLQ